MNDKTWDSILQKKQNYHDYEFPCVTVIIPTFNSIEKISITLDSVIHQNYPDLEVVIVDAGSADRTLETVKNYRDERIKIYSVALYQRYEMLNKGILHAKGEYFNILFPGDYYIHKEATYQIMELALDNLKPDLNFCGTLIRDGKSDPKILFRPLTLEVLKLGLQPTSLQSCWFRKDTIRELGKFNTSYQFRGGYELMCRFALTLGLKQTSVNRVLTDYDLRLVTLSMIWCHFKETIRILYSYFGIGSTLKWLFTQRDISRMMSIWWRSAKTIFFKR